MPSTQTVREALNLASRYVPSSGDKGSHPDQRPCPPWCWIATHPVDEYDHEVESDRPGEAMHYLERSNMPVVPTVCYPAERRSGEDVVLATVETGLSQIGQSRPIVEVDVRSYPWVKGQGTTHDLRQALRLTLDEAAQLARVLNYLVEVGEGRREVINESGESDQ